MPSSSFVSSPKRSIVLVGDNTFATLELLHAACQLRRPVHIVTRLRLDAALYHPAPQRQAKQLGRPRIVGKRKPPLQTLVGNPYTPWETMVLNGWYGQGNYTLQIAVNMVQGNITVINAGSNKVIASLPCGIAAQKGAIKDRDIR